MAEAGEVPRRMKQRDWRIDNIRYVLILLVVFGHLIEPMRGEDAAGLLYRVIYVFHMPAFVFLTGYFARFSWRRIGALALAYAVFQTIHIILAWALSPSPDAQLNVQFLTPYWTMWYLLATIVWMFALPLLRTRSRVRAGATLAVSVAIALAVGFIDDVGYFLSLSRIFAFAPFFIAGYYARQLPCGSASEDAEGRKPPMRPARRRILAAVGAASAVATVAVMALCDINPASLYNSMPYSSTGSGALQRLAMMALASGWICLLFAVIPARRIPAVTRAGAHTMPTYLLHSMVVLVLRAYVPMPFGEAGNIVVALLLAIAMTLALGNRFLDRIVRFGL